MKRQFTVRITDEESDKLVRIKKLTGEKTDMATIRFMINHYEELNKRYSDEIKRSSELSRRYEELFQKVKRFNIALKDLLVFNK